MKSNEKTKKRKAEELGKENYIVKWNDEYLEIQILAGPLTEEEAQKILRDETIEAAIRLLQCSREEAEEKYDDSLNGEEESEDIHASCFGSSIFFGSCNEEYMQICKYGNNSRL